MTVNGTDNQNLEKLNENYVQNLFIGSVLLFFAFIMVLFSIYGSSFNLAFNLDILLLFIVIIFNLLGYCLILLPDIQKNLKNFLIRRFGIISFLLVPIILLLSILLINVMSNSLKTSEAYNEFVLAKYLTYCLIPILIVSLSKLERVEYIFSNKLFDLGVFLFLLFWTWWGIEFTNDLNLFPDLIRRFGYFLNLLALTTLAWSFFIIWDIDIKRSFTRLFTFNNFKIILISLGILLVLIVPAGIITSFLQINTNHLLNMGLFGAIGYLILAIIGVFLVQGIGEELLFRGFFYFILLNKIKELDEKYRGYILLTLFFFVAVLLALTPYVRLANPIKTGIVNSDSIPIKIIYPVIAIIYFAFGIIFMIKTKNLTYTMVLWSSMLFGWAHFEDWRYVIFATIAGLGYCETYRRTNNLFAASVLHMLVDVTWGAILTT